MGINSAKRWFAVDRSGKLAFFKDYIKSRKDILLSFPFSIVKDMLRWQEFK